MSDQQILPCVMCGQHHEQMLMLICMHDPCINCAAIHYCSTQPPNSSLYSCAKCGQDTELDTTSVVELQRIYNQLKGKKRYDYRKGQGSITETQKNERPASSNRNVRKQYKNILQNLQPKEYKDYKDHNKEYNKDYNKERDYEVSHHDSQANYQPSNQSYTPISQPSYPTNPYNNILTRKSQEPFYMCQTHPQEQLSYFCFTCSGPICPQCAIHGTHRQHQVQTTRKAIKTIKTNLQKCQEGVGQQIGSLVGIVDTYKNRIKQMNSQVKKEKELIKDNFNMLRNILAEKEKQFQRTIDSCFESNNNIIKNETSNYDRIIDQHTAAKKSIQGTMKKDDLSILQDYSKREKQANNAIQSSKNRRYNPDLQGLKEIDYELFKDQMDQLSGIMNALKLTVQPKRRTD